MLTVALSGADGGPHAQLLPAWMFKISPAALRALVGAAC